ncbi:DUF4190 domain-containing protein [Streptomyces sp. NPDC002537]
MTTPPPPPPPAPQQPPSQPAPQPPLPQWGMPPAPPMGFPPAPSEPPRNSSGIAALVLGLVGLSCAPVPFIFWIGAILGILAVIFGLVGLSHARSGQATNKGMSIAGTVLGGVSVVVAVIGLVLTIGLVREARDTVDEETRETETSADAYPSPSDEPDDPDKGRTTADQHTLDFGKTASYKNGLKVTVDKPEEIELGGYNVKEGFVAYKVTATVENGTPKDVDLELTTVKARDGDGAGLERTWDISKHIGFSQGLVGRPHPGKSVTGVYIFLVPEKKARDRMEISIEPGVVTYKEATWSGSVK